MSDLTLTSPAFADGEPIPQRHTCRGKGSVPDLRWSGVPEGADSLALVVSDPDAPRGTFIHWVLYDLAPSVTGLPRGAVPAGAREAANSAGTEGWYPPCPPRGTHRYVFTLYALGSSVAATRGGDTRAVIADIARRAIASATLTGLVAAG